MKINCWINFCHKKSAFKVKIAESFFGDLKKIVTLTPRVYVMIISPIWRFCLESQWYDIFFCLNSCNLS
jgi:hypothetical protein